VSYLIFNFYTVQIIECKNEKVQIQLDSKLDLNWSPILRHMFIFFWGKWIISCKSQNV